MTLCEYHEPVMLAEVVEYLNPVSHGLYVDATLGGGGHAEAILERSSPHGVLIGIDRDSDALAFAGERLKKFGDRIRPVAGRMGEIESLMRKKSSERADGIVADLGVSSHQFDEGQRGFSFSNSVGNRIGGTESGEGNVISANSDGIGLLTSPETVVQGNIIGLASSGMAASGSTQQNGIIVGFQSNATIGGRTAAARNIIGGNQNGIWITNSDQAPRFEDLAQHDQRDHRCRSLDK